MGQWEDPKVISKRVDGGAKRVKYGTRGASKLHVYRVLYIGYLSCLWVQFGVIRYSLKFRMLSFSEESAIPTVLIRSERNVKEHMVTRAEYNLKFYKFTALLRCHFSYIAINHKTALIAFAKRSSEPEKPLGLFFCIYIYSHINERNEMWKQQKFTFWHNSERVWKQWLDTSTHKLERKLMNSFGKKCTTTRWTNNKHDSAP